MRSVRTKRFKELFAKLPSEVQKQAIDKYNIFKENPDHPSLNFECINEKTWYTVRINKSYRAVGTWKGDTIRWFFIGTHTKCDRFL